MIISIFGYFFLLVGILILALPLIFVELSRPRDWLMGGLFLFLALFLLEENDLLGNSINLLVISMAILYGKLLLEIIQNRWHHLSLEEKKQIGSFERWFESFRQLGKILAQLGKGLLNFFQSFITQSEKAQKEKKWVHPKLKEEIKKKVVEESDLTDPNRMRNDELNENEETS